MSILKEKMDYKYLEEELHQAIRDDELYQLQNNAKFRAVEQRVPTYNDFREMVNAAHLKPLESNDMKDRITIPKNIFAQRSEDWALVSEANNSELIASLSENDETLLKSIPKDTKEFLSVWKNIMDSKLKFEYLLDARVHLGKNIFLCEVPCEFFEDVINLCSRHLSSDKMEDVIDLFIKLSQSNRFELNLIFLPEEKKVILKKLLQELISTEIKECQMLLNNYKMILK